MPSRNICKFINSASSDKLEVSLFILESDLNTMHSPYTLKSHRAILVTSGTGIFQIGNQQVPSHPGNLFFIFKLR